MAYGVKWRNMARTEQFGSDKIPKRFYFAEMDNDVRNSLEAIANLIYLIRKSLHDPAATIAYADLADDRVKAIARHFALDVPLRAETIWSTQNRVRQAD
jgi:hypothetical protein